MSLYVTINLLCAIMIILLMFMVSRGVMHETDQKTFFNLCFHTQLLFSLDVLWVFLDGATFAGAWALNHIINAAYFAQCGVLCYYWSQYSLFLSGSSEKYSGKLFKALFALPMVVEVVLSVASVWTGWYFTIDSANHYHRGDWLFIQVTVMFIYLVYSLLVAVFTIKRQRGVVNKNKLYAISALGFLPFTSQFLQAQFPGESVFCTGATLGLIIVFLEIQREMISLDPLTRLNNRNQASIYLSSRFKQDIPGKRLYQFIMDLDKFKGINDTFGHMEGDNALVIVSAVLKVVCGPRGHFISRYGGDEFVVFANLPDNAAADDLCHLLEKKLADYSKALPYTLAMSIGYAALREGETEESLMSRADASLYEIKKRKHAER